MANKKNNIDVMLSFSADTKQVQTQLKELKEELKALSTNTLNNTSSLGLTKELQESVATVDKLRAVLKGSTTEVGKLDIGKFRQQLQSANLDAEKIARSMFAMGEDGVKAFTNLSQSIMMAETPLKRTNKLVQELSVTLKNTAKWQFSSGLIHGFSGAIQKAYSYAQDLNKSLNNIRIVTGQTTDQMTKFAKEANEAAKALSTTTTAYTDASLIFYQQGLRGDDVKERTETVLKLSNVTGEAVKDISSYMTAIWNNFADGTESLEHYADVITALGAATASSSAEIADGLEKFAAIGQTVGLSYDYATAALATVVAKTRLSADTVGNAFKTIFARLQSLKLGETLEDEVDLTKYTKALDAVGVEVVGLGGQLRDLDDILNDLSGKWELMTEAEKAALAQTVAGTRQYSQFIALMENWGEVQKNVIVAKDSEGSLQKQANIYAEGWEGARKRVQAAWQQIYTQILNDDFFIEVADKIAKIVSGVSSLLDSFGGLKGILPGISSLILSIFGKDLAKGINNAIYNMQLFNKTGQNYFEKLKQDFATQLDEKLIEPDEEEIQEHHGFENKAVLEGERNKLKLQQEYYYTQQEILSSGRELTDIEKAQGENLLDKLKYYQEIYTEEAKILDAKREEAKISKQDLGLFAENAIADSGKEKSRKGTQVANTVKKIDKFKENILMAKGVYSVDSFIKNKDSETGKISWDYDKIKLYKDQLKELGMSAQEVEKFLHKLFAASDDKERINSVRELGQALTAIKNDLVDTKNNLPKGDENLAEDAQQLVELEQQYAVLNELKEEFFSEPIENTTEEQLNEIKSTLEEMSSTLLTEGFIDNDTNEILGGILDSEKDIKTRVAMVDAFEDKIASLGVQIDETSKKINKGFNKNTESGKVFDQQLQQAREDSKKLGAQVVKTANSQSKANKIYKNASDVLKTFSGTSKQAGDYIVDLASGISSSLMAINSLSTMPNIIGDMLSGTKDFGEGLFQIFTHLTTAIPTLMSGITKLKSVITELVAPTPLENFKKMLKDQNSELSENEKSILGVITAKELDIAKTDKETLVNTIFNDLKEQGNELDKETIGNSVDILKAKAADIIKTNLQTIATASLGKALKIVGQGFANAAKKAKAFLTSLGPIGWALLAIVAAITAVSAALNILNKHRENQAKRDQEAADLHKELTDQYVEEAEKIHNLTDAYKELYDQYKDQSIGLDEMREKTIALMKEYDNYEGYVLSLADQWDSINDLLSGKTTEANNQIINSASQDVANYKKTIESALEQAVSSSDQYKHRLDWNRNGSFGLSIDLVDMAWRNDRQKEFAQALEEEFAKTTGWTFGLSKDQLSLDALTQAIVNDSDAVKKILSNFSDLTAAQQVGSYIEAISGQIDNFTESSERLKEASLENAFIINFDKKNFDSAQDYFDLLEKIKQDSQVLKLDLSDEEIKEWVHKYILGIDEVEQYVKNIDIGNYLLKQLFGIEDGQKIDEIKAAWEKTIQPLIDKGLLSSDIKFPIDINYQDLVNRISEFNSDEQAYIILHPQMLWEELLSDDYKTKIQDKAISWIGYKNSKEKVDTSYSLLSNYKEKGEFSSTDIQNAVDLGIIETSSVLTDDQLLNKIITFYQECSDATNSFYTDAKKQADDYALETSNAVDRIKGELDELKERQQEVDFNNFILGSDFVNESNQADIKSILELYQSDFENPEWIKGFLNNIRLYKDKGYMDGNYTGFFDDLAGLSGKTISELVDSFDKLSEDENFQLLYDDTIIKNKEKELEDAAKAAEEATKAQQALTESTIDYSLVLESLQKQIEKTHQNIDDLQAAFDTMKSAQDEYNEAGAYSTDTIQSLLNLSPQYLKYLSIEDDKIEINTKAMIQQKEAYYDLLEVQYAERLNMELDLLLSDKVDEAQKNSIINTYKQVIATGIANGTLAIFASRAEAVAKAQKYMGTAIGNAAQGMADYANNIADVLQLGRKFIDYDFTIGGKDSSKDNDYKEFIEELPDRYHDINEAIKKVTHSMEMLDKIKDKLAGPGLINALTKENKLIEKQQNNYKKLAQQLNLEQRQLQSDKQLGQFGAKFNKNGMITNYEDTFRAIETYMLNATEKYNNAIKGGVSDAAKQAAEDEYNEAQRLYDKAKDWLNRADEVIEELREAEQKWVDEQLKLIENNLKKFTEQFKIKIDVNDAKKELIEFAREINKDFTKVYSTSDIASSEINSYVQEGLLDSENLDTSLDRFSGIMDILNDKNYAYGQEGTQYANMAEGINDARDAYEDAMNHAKNLYSAYQNAYEAYLDNLDTINDKWDKIVDKISDAQDELNHYQKVTELLYSDTRKGNEILTKYYESSVQVQLKEQDVLRQKIDAYKEIQAQMDAENVDKDTKEYQKVVDTIKQSEKDLRSSIESYLNTIQDQFSHSIKVLIDDMNRAMVNLGAPGSSYTLSTISERWKDAQNAAKGYYDDVQKVYQLEQLENKWNEALRDTKTAKNQQTIKSIMDAQLKNLQTKTKLSEYDITLAEKELELTKAQMALEDARNNKNTMKLVRNEQGNWAYQYVADEDDLANKEQRVLDLLYEKYNFVKESVASSTEELLQLQQTAQERLTAIMEEYKTADEERQHELEEEYQYFYNYYYGENGLIVQKAEEAKIKQEDLNKEGMTLLWGLYTDNNERFDLMTEAQQKAIEELKKNGYNTLLQFTKDVATDDGSLYNQIKNKASKVIEETQNDWVELSNKIIAAWGENPDSVRSTVNSAYETFNNSLSTYEENIKKCEETSNISFDNIANDIWDVWSELDDVNYEVDTLKSEMGDLKNQREQIKKLRKQWEEAKIAILETQNQLSSFLDLLKEKDTYVINIKFEYDKLDLSFIPTERTIKVRTDSTGGGKTESGYLLYGAGGEKTGTKYETLQEVYDVLSPMSPDASRGMKIKDLSTGKEIDNTTPAKNQADAYGKGPNYAVVYKGTYKLFNGYTDLTKDEAEDIRIKHQGQRTLEVVDKRIVSGATGMYTGEWGSEGKLAVLHEKELVLNKEDTSNILNAVAAVREISGIGSSIANTISTGISNIVSGMLGIKPASAGYPSSTTNNNATNTFHIHAEFPNANSVAEIQEAILNLPNLASQYLGQNNI